MDERCEECGGLGAITLPDADLECGHRRALCLACGGSGWDYPAELYEDEPDLKPAWEEDARRLCQRKREILQRPAPLHRKR